MENNSELCFHQQHLHTLSANLRLLGHTFDLGQMNNEPMCRNPYTVKDSTLKTGPFFPVPEVPLSKIPNWFHAIPHYRQAFTASLVSAPKEKSPASLPDFMQHGPHKSGFEFGSAQKKFLVFDQSGDNTTMIYSSEVQTSVKYGTDWIPISPYKESLNCTYNPSPMAKDEEREDMLRYVSEDEMHEDTEELNALLYSDSYSSEDDDDTTSTGHSPSTISNNGIMDNVVETEEVDSLALPTKRQKLFEGGYKIPSHLKTHSQFASEDAESNSGHEQGIENKDYSLFRVKRSRKEKIRETVSILQSLIPSMSEKNPVGVLDEAIHYLRSLKVKAKALGFDSL